MIHELSAVEQQVIRLAHEAKTQRDALSQRQFEQAIAPVLTAHDCTGLTVSIVDTPSGLGLQVSE